MSVKKPFPVLGRVLEKLFLELLGGFAQEELLGFAHEELLGFA